MDTNKLPFPFARRLPVYFSVLNDYIRKDVESITSGDLIQQTGFTAEQINEDLLRICETLESSYNVVLLKEQILTITSLNDGLSTVIIGAGNLGTALARYNIGSDPYIKLVGIFDVDQKVIGTEIMGFEVKHVSRLKEVIKKYYAFVAILTVPATQAQQAVDHAIKSGIKVIYNFASVKLEVPEGTYLHNVDLSLDLRSIIFYATVVGRVNETGDSL